MPNSNGGALLHHLMEMKTSSVPQSDPSQSADREEKLQMTEYRIYVGLNDSETKKQKYETDRYKGILKDVCRSYHVAFSVGIEEGGYYHDDGEYTEETSLVLALIDADPAVVKEIAKDLCVFFHQESVLVTQTRIDGQFIYENL